VAEPEYQHGGHEIRLVLLLMEDAAGMLQCSMSVEVRHGDTGSVSLLV
jgi:hypothetical protein